MADLGGKSVRGNFKPLWTTESGIKVSTAFDEDGTMHVLKSQDMAPILDATHAMRTENDGYNADRSMRRVAHLPALFIDHCRNVEGWDPLAAEHRDRLVRVLNDPDYAYLRTAGGRVALVNGEMH